MRKIHIGYLTLGLLLMFLSGYSITMINMKHNIRFEWYSKREQAFMPTIRDTNFYTFSAQKEEIQPKFVVITGESSNIEGLRILRSMVVPDFQKYVYIYATLGEMAQMDANIKLLQMAQRGNVVDCVVSVNVTTERKTGGLYFPEDFIRIERKMLVNKGNLIFVFKDQNKEKLDEVKVEILES